MTMLVRVEVVFDDEHRHAEITGDAGGPLSVCDDELRSAVGDCVADLVFSPPSVETHANGA
jgi:hypothetical protein